jgi:uncharacterized membrane protein
MKIAILLGAAGLCLAASSALAQTVEEHTTVVKERPSGAGAGAATGAMTGAVVGGPIGAAVGAVAGAVVGHTVAPPAEVRTYITAQRVAPVTYSDQIVVGRPIVGEVTWLDVPDYTKYQWAYLNGQRVLVDADTHTVVAIY